MLPTQKTTHTYPAHTSAEWIAHNAAMKAKQPLLGHGPKPRIGAFARWNTPVTPAVEIHTARRGPTFKQAVRDLLMIVGAVTVLGLMFSVGVVVGF